MPNRHCLFSSDHARGAALAPARVFRSGCLRVAVLLWLALAAPARADYTASVDPNVVVVTNFEGWGTSLCWWANVVGGYSNRDTYADLAFSQLKLNIVRYNIGGGENPTNHFMEYRAQMPGFEPTNGVWNWSADANQRWMLQAALARGVNHVEAFANSPPWWMTVSGSVTGSTNGTSNNLRTSFEQSFAMYLAMVVSNLSVVDGVHFDAVTPMNEPNEDWWVYGGSQEGCYMSTAQQARVVNDLRAALDALGQPAGIAAPDDYSEEDTLNALDAYGAALGNVSRIDTHSYDANDAASLRNLGASLHIPVWVSEYGHCDATGMNQARRIHDDIAMMGSSAWIYWQVVDGDTCWGPLSNPEVASTNASYTTGYTVQESFYVIGQFSEFVRPGCQILSVTDTNSLAAYNPANSTLVIVALNDTTKGFNVTYDLSAFSGLPSQVSLSRTSASENMASLAPLPVNQRQFTSYLPAESVTTHVLTNVTVVAAPPPYEALLVADAPAACWRLNETNGSIAYESIAELDGTYGANTTNGVPGVQNPPFYGFASNNTAVALDPSATNTGAGYVTAPALNLDTNTVTLTAWVYPFADITNYQGVVFTRASTYANGINYVAESSRLNMIGYTWNKNNIDTYGWASGLVTPPGQWSFVALTIAPTQAVIYVGANGVLLAATNAIAHDVEAWNGSTLLGADTVSLPSRIFQGKLDEVAVFDYTLSPAQIAQLYSAALTGGPVTLGVQRSGGSLLLSWLYGTLLAAPGVNGPWTNVPDAAPPSYTVIPSAAQMFYRVRVQ